MSFSEYIYWINFLFVTGSSLVKSSFPMSTTECDKIFLTSRLTWFSSPNYPFNYTERLTCRYAFIVDEVTPTSKNLCFQFRKFQLKQTPQCRDDFLELEGRGRFCGNGWKDGEEMKSIFEQFCVSLKERRKYTIRFQSVDYSTDQGFYGIPYLSEDYEMNKSSCEMMTEIPCLTGSLRCIQRTDLCGSKAGCEDASDVSFYHAGCSKDASNALEMISFEDHVIFSSSNWNVENAYAIPPYDHTTLSPQGHVIKTTGYSSLLHLETILIPPHIDKCLSFWYFAHGQVQKFELYITSAISEKWRLVWMAREDMGYGWKLGEVQLGEQWGDSIKIKFESTQETASSLSIDDISILPGVCSGEDISCTFELSTCGWNISDSFVLDSSKKYLEKQDHHHNLSMHSLSPSALLVSRPVTTRSPVACLTFDFMPSCSVGRCSIIVSGLKYDGTSTELWSTSEVVDEDYDLDNFWETARVTFETMKFEGNVRLQIEVVHRGWFDAAIDNITFTTGICPNKKGFEPTKTLLPFQPIDPNSDYMCPPRSFKCVKFNKCIDQTMTCNGLIDCPDASDETDCPKTGGPLKYSEGSLQPSFLVAMTVTITIVVVGAVTITFFIVMRKMMMRRRMGRPTLCYQPGHDLPDFPYDLPKPPPYSLHPPPYSPEAPPYTSREQINLKQFDTPPPPFSDLESSI